MLLASLWASYDFYSHNTQRTLHLTLPFLFSSPAPSSPQRRPFHCPLLTPYIHLHTALTLLLLFASHTQIILRVCVTNPVLWWFVADLLFDADGGGAREGEGKKEEEEAASKARRRQWGRRWVGYCVVWGGVSIVLWGGFLPPA